MWLDSSTKVQQVEARFWHTVTTHEGASTFCMLAIARSLLTGGIYLIGGAHDLSGSYSNTVEQISYGMHSNLITTSPALKKSVAITSAIPVTEDITF